MKVLITGGAGYLGSIIATALEARGHVPVILDSLYRGSSRFILGRHFYQADIGDGDAVQRIFHEHPDLSCTIHCAGLTSVPESMSNPAGYWRENLAKSLALFASLVAVGRADVVFSSTAAVYAPTANFEVRETDPLKPASPYASSKLAVEMALGDLTLGSPLRTIVLRYFNPIGSDPEYRTGNYDPVSSHVLGQLIAAALGKIDVFTLTGTDLPTRDGTGMRDYIHAWDLAQAHVRAVETFDQVLDDGGRSCQVMNLGTGTGTTVRELIAAFERVSGRQVPVREAAARPGDVVGAFANVDLAARILGWQAEFDLDASIASALEWERRRGSQFDAR